GFLQFGEAYAQMMCANAHELAEALDVEGLPVVARARGFTQSHHIALSAHDFGGGTHAARNLEESLILSSGIEVPGPAVAEDYNGLRFGTQEITRWGMQPMHMPWIGSAIADRLLGRRNVHDVRADVEK